MSLSYSIHHWIRKQSSIIFRNNILLDRYAAEKFEKRRREKYTNSNSVFGSAAS